MAKHLASSISAKRLTRSGTAIFEDPHAGWSARAAPADYHRGPAGTLPRPPLTTLEPNKSHNEFERRSREDAGIVASGHSDACPPIKRAVCNVIAAILPSRETRRRDLTLP